MINSSNFYLIQSTPEIKKSNINNSLNYNNISYNLSIDTSQIDQPTITNFVNNIDNLSSTITHINSQNHLNIQDEFIHEPTVSIKNIIVNHWNCNSIKNKELEFKLFLQQNKPDIVSLNEIKCCNNLANYIFNIEGYNSVFKCKDNRSGGVALVIKESIEFNENDISSKFNDQIVGINCTFKKLNISFFSYYNPPDKELNSEIFKYIELNFTNNLIMGDLNAKCEIFNSFKNNKNGELLENILLESNAQVLNNNNPTFHIIRNNNNNYGELLDYFIASPLTSNLSYDYKVVQTDFDSIQALQFHSVIEVKLQLELSIDETENNTNSSGKFLYAKANWTSYKSKLNNFELYIEQNLEVMYKNLNNIISLSASNSIPIVSNKTRTKPALPNYIIKTIKVRNKLQRIYKKNNTIQNKNNLYDSVNKVKYDIKEFKNKNWSNFINKLGNCPLSTKPLWNRINRLNKKKQPSSIPTLIYNNETLDTDEKKALAFGKKLENTFTESNDISNGFNEEQKSYVDNFIISKNYIKNYNNSQFFEISLIELNEVIKNINNKTSIDSNRISNIMLKNLPENFKVELIKYYNKSINSGKLPYECKQSIITMIPKKGIKTDIKNYRPISSTPCLTKLFEKIIHKRLTNFLNENNIIIKQQSGFRKNRQTRDNLLFMNQKILETFGNRKKACCIFFDIQSAFDKIWHNGLIYKLIKLKVPLYLINWIQDFLTERTFKVKVGNYMTKSYKITCSTPQGTVLAPLLFSIYINDIPIFKDKKNKFSLLFADDLMYMIIFKKITNPLQNIINDQLLKLENWLNNWRLKMAPEKCAYSIFSNNRKAGEKGTKGHNKEKLTLNLYNEEILLNNNMIFLGLRFDKFLTFKNQIFYLKSSCNERINIIKTLTHKSWNLDTKTLLQLYKALIRSLLDYSLFIYPLITNKNKRKLQFIQDNALRLIYKKKWDFDSKILHEWANMEDLNTRSKNLIKNYFDQAKTNLNPLINDLLNEFELYENNFKNENIMTLIDYI